MLRTLLSCQELMAPPEASAELLEKYCQGCPCFDHQTSRLLPHAVYEMRLLLVMQLVEQHCPERRNQ